MMFMVVVTSTLIGLAHAGTVEVIDCVFPEEVELGDRAHLQVLVVNNDKEPITLFDPRWVEPGKHWGDDVMGQGRVHGRWIPHRIVEPEEMWYFSVDASFTREAGSFAAQAEMCVVHGKVEPLVILAAQDATSDEERNEAYLRFERMRIDPCSALDGERKVLKAAWKVVQPTGKDKAYYDAYIRPWVESGDRAVKRELDEKRRRRSRELRAAEPPADPSSLPFSEIQKRQSFKELEDNRYAALAGYGGWSKVTLLDTVRRYARITPGPGKYHYGPHVFQNAITSFDRAEYFVRKHNLGWQAYLSRAVFFIGTAEEKRALKAIHEVATSSPDCVARYLAKRVLEVYDEVRGGKKH